MLAGSEKICLNCAKNCQDSSWLAGCPWNQWKIVSHSKQNMPLIFLKIFTVFFLSVPFSDLFANTLKTE